MQGNEQGTVAGNISREVVQVMHRHTGRGPTKARTEIGRDSVLVLLEDALTQAERTLVEHAAERLVLDARRKMQRVMREELVAIIETHTGRKVRAFMSENHVDPDAAAEVFMLEPDPAA